MPGAVQHFAVFDFFGAGIDVDVPGAQKVPAASHAVKIRGIEPERRVEPFAVSARRPVPAAFGHAHAVAVGFGVLGKRRRHKGGLLLERGQRSTALTRRGVSACSRVMPRARVTRPVSMVSMVPARAPSLSAAGAVRISSSFGAAFPAKRRSGIACTEGMRLTLTGLGAARLFRRRGQADGRGYGPRLGDHIAHVRAFPQLLEEVFAVFAAAHGNDFVRILSSRS